MTFLKHAVSAGFFLIELTALVSLAFWGIQIGNNLPTRLVLGISSPLLAAFVWGMFVAPRALTSSVHGFRM